MAWNPMMPARTLWNQIPHWKPRFNLYCSIVERMKSLLFSVVAFVSTHGSHSRKYTRFLSTKAKSESALSGSRISEQYRCQYEEKACSKRINNKLINWFSKLEMSCGLLSIGRLFYEQKGLNTPSDFLLRFIRLFSEDCKILTSCCLRKAATRLK